MSYSNKARKHALFYANNINHDTRYTKQKHLW